jgi:hypothetical protein
MPLNLLHCFPLHDPFSLDVSARSVTSVVLGLTPAGVCSGQGRADRPCTSEGAARAVLWGAGPAGGRGEREPEPHRQGRPTASVAWVEAVPHEICCGRLLPCATSAATPSF